MSKNKQTCLVKLNASVINSKITTKNKANNRINTVIIYGLYAIYSQRDVVSI